jgi:drug/metabolite transporter (DMT)-like permease
MTVLGLAFMLGPAAIEFRSTDVDAVPVVAWLSVAYYGLVPTVLGFVWWYKGAERVSGAEAGVMTAVMPLAAAGLSALVLSEPLGIQHALGLFLAISAILLTARG